MNTVNTYENTAWLYDYDNRDNLTADIEFYKEYAVKTGGTVLELGCGTGRVALKLADIGIEVTGLDLSETMLESFREKLRSTDKEVTDKITLVQGSMAEFKLDKSFGLIIAPFRAFQALTEDDDIKSSIKCIREHLTEDGLFIINVFRPYKVLDESWCYEEIIQWERTDENTGAKIVKKHWGDKIDTEKQIIYPHYGFEITDANGDFQRIEDHLKLKYYYANQLKDYLTKGGLTIVEKFGWYDKSDVENGRELIYVCKKCG
ncbi:class I SAM-dependent methyltransferase [Clostridium sp.]|uniref:class I SAM-dependent DNA methyltransferase n=1 Tax=Clostridium sp. TaxID=1506 RepID=UPI002FC6F391